MKLDIHTGVVTFVALLSVLAAYGLWAGIHSIRKARTLKFFRMRRDRMVTGWRMLLLSVVFIAVALVTSRFAEPIAYHYFPPTITPTFTATATLVPTTTLTPTITQTPTITLTPSVTDTPTITPTPHMPLVIEDLFTSTTTPNPEAVFSPIQFASALKDYLPVNPTTVFKNPVGHVYAQFSYDKMTPGAQWSALWYYGNELVFYETNPWDGGTGGFGYSDWDPEPYRWLAGEYEVQIFVGLIWKTSGRFTVEGQPPTAVPSATPSPTRTSTSTHAPTATAKPSDTRVPSPTATLKPTVNTPTNTPENTHAPTPTKTPPTPAATHAPTPTGTFIPPPLLLAPSINTPQPGTGSMDMTTSFPLAVSIFMDGTITLSLTE